MLNLVSHAQCLFLLVSCQVCGDGGTLLCCPRCPVAVHAKCAGVEAKNFLSCSHHRCVLCNKNTERAGGLLFPCQSCPSAYCEDCRPAVARVIGDCPRFEYLGFTTSRAVYIHCSDICENVAKVDFGWKPASLKAVPCPPPLDTSEHFRTNAVEDATLAEEEGDDRGDQTTSLRRRRVVGRVSSTPQDISSMPVRTASAWFDTTSPFSAQKRRRLVGKENTMANDPVVIDVDSPEVVEIIDVDVHDDDGIVQ